MLICPATRGAGNWNQVYPARKIAELISQDHADGVFLTTHPGFRPGLYTEITVDRRKGVMLIGDTPAIILHTFKSKCEGSHRRKP
jgi:hypothetical protein